MGRPVGKAPALSAGLEAERAVLGSMLIDADCVNDILAEVDERDFVSTANRLIFQAARAVMREGGHVDAITVRAKLGDAIAESPDRYLIELMEVTPTSANWREYAQIMREQAALARIRDLADQLADASRRSLDECRPILSAVEAQLSERRGVRVYHMPDILTDFAERHAAGTTQDYMHYGIDAIDSRSFVRRGDVVVLGGYPSDGKTALALMIAYHMAKSHRVGFFSLETDKSKVGDRIVTHGMRIDFDSIKRNKLTDRDWGTFAVGSDDAAHRQLDVIEASGMTVSDIISQSIAYGYDVVFIDYVQLVVPEGNRRDLRSEQMATVSRALHTFAQSRGVLVVELAQLSRPERGGWRAPDMHDLKESGQFEQDADQIIMIYRPNPQSDYSQEKCRVIQIAKNKEGRRGSGVFTFDGNHQTFMPYKRVQPDSAAQYNDGEAPGQIQFEELPADTPSPL